MKVTSSVLEKSKYIPEKYTCDGVGVNPPLEISGVPEDAVSLVLIMDDPDAPGGVFTHWLVWNIGPDVSVIEENSVPDGAKEGVNSGGEDGYFPPCPPSGVHRYFFHLYALEENIKLGAGSSRAELEEAMSGLVIEEAEFMEKYPA